MTAHRMKSRADLCHILAPFPIFDKAGNLIAAVQKGQVWSGQTNNEGDFVFWIPDKSGTLWKAKIKAGNENVKIYEYEKINYHALNAGILEHQLLAEIWQELNGGGGYVTVKEAAEILKISRAAVSDWKHFYSFKMDKLFFKIQVFKILKIHGFVWRHLLVANFWWMFYAAIKSHFTGKSYMIGSLELMSFIEIGANKPDKAVLDAGLAVSTPGHIFGKRILHYWKNKT